jgi:hypothetical protein
VDIANLANIIGKEKTAQATAVAYGTERHNDNNRQPDIAGHSLPKAKPGSVFLPSGF